MEAQVLLGGLSEGEVEGALKGLVETQSVDGG